MEKNKSVWRYKGIGAILLVLCVLAIAENIACFALETPVKLKVGAVEGLIGCAFALYYMFKGYSKNAASAYKAFMVIAFLNFQLMAVTINMKMPAVAAFVSLAACLKASFALALAVSHDMGKKLSCGMALTIAVLTTVELLVAIVFVYVPDAARGGVMAVVAAALRSGSNLFIAWMGCAMTWAKYRDKADRAAK